MPCGESYLVCGVRVSRVAWRGGGGGRSGSHMVSTMWVSNGCARRGDVCGSGGSGQIADRRVQWSVGFGHKGEADGSRRG